jgi:hypothetical protein
LEAPVIANPLGIELLLDECLRKYTAMVSPATITRSGHLIHSQAGTNFPPADFLAGGRHPPFTTAPVADSQRFSDPLFKTSARADSQRWRPRFASFHAASAIVNAETHQPPSQPGRAERAIDTATDVSRTIAELSASLQAAVNRLTETIATARRPGKPLATVSALARDAPLASLFAAFLFGLAVARRLGASPPRQR